MASESEHPKIEIEDGIPFQRGKGRGRSAIYPWLSLEVGQSFLFPASVAANSAYTIACAASHRNAPKKFTTAKTPEGYRCWRIA